MMQQEHTHRKTSDRLTLEQNNALNKLPEHKDPFFAVHEAMHAIKAGHMGENSIPLSGYDVSGECAAFSNCAAMSLRRMFLIDPKDLCIIQLATLIHGCRAEDVFDRGIPKLTDGEHTILFIRNGLRFLPGEQEGDVFFDSTAAQFPSNRRKYERSENVFEYLNQYGGEDGAAMAEVLYNRGYVKIPTGTAGMRTLGVLIAAYYSKREWIANPEPIAPEALYLGPANITSESTALRYFDNMVPEDPYRTIEWHSDLLFDQNVPYGQLRFENQRFNIPYNNAWHEINF